LQPDLALRAKGRTREGRSGYLVGTSATGLQGKEGDLLRMVLKWSIGLTVIMSILVVLQAYVLKFMIPG
jgi:hypothetical protein